MLKTNCIYFCADRPCSYHKESGIVCGACSQYKPLGIKILIIKLGALGDVLRTTSILRPLIREYSKNGLEPQVFWVTYQKSLPVLKNISEIKEVLPYNAETLARLMAEKFDLMINLDLSPDALALSSVVKAAKSRGFGLDSKGLPAYLNPEAEEWFKMSHNDILKKKNTKTYQEHILRIAGLKPENSSGYRIIVNLDKEEREFADKFAKKYLKGKTTLKIGLNTGGGDVWQKKEWPADSTVRLIKLLNKGINGRKTSILLFGGEKEAGRNAYIIRKSGKGIINTGSNNTLREFFSLLNECDIIVATDTLALHASLSLGKKTVALFGPTSPAEIEMYGLGEKIIAPMECKVCYKRKCDKTPDCMVSISPETVYKAIQKLI